MTRKAQPVTVTVTVTMPVPVTGALALLLLVSACQCGAPPPPPPPPGGQLVAVVTDGGFDLQLRNVDQPMRELQVDVKLAGAHASAATSSADVVEAGLDAPKDDFTVVVADTRRLNLPSAPVVHVVTDAAPTKITLARAIAVDAAGKKRELTVVVP